MYKTKTKQFNKKKHYILNVRFVQYKNHYAYGEFPQKMETCACVCVCVCVFLSPDPQFQVNIMKICPSVREKENHIFCSCRASFSHVLKRERESERASDGSDFTHAGH